MKNGKVIKLALAGNPNSGKTTIFNSITGSHQKVGNYAGVTVEKKEGIVKYNDYEFVIYDLPGIYSLTAYSVDEVITRDFIMHEKPDIVIDVIDATNIERNLYLLMQLNELEVPVLGAINIIDQAESMGIMIDEKKISELIGIPMIKTVGTKGKGMDSMLDAAINLYEKGNKQYKKLSYGPEVEEHIEKISSIVKSDRAFSMRFPFRWFAIKLLEKDSNAVKLAEEHSIKDVLNKSLDISIKDIESHFGRDAEIVLSEQRYGYIHGIVEESVTRESDIRTISEKIDRVLLNRIIGFPVFLFILWAIFQLTFTLSEYPMRWLESFFGWGSTLLTNIIPEGELQSLVVDGIIGGVGGVMSFVPLVIILFAFISFLEDSGYMARAAFIMDKFLHIFGLHGQSFVPMMLGFGCSVPAVMAARTLKNEKDRILTVLVTPFMSCGAKLPVHILLAGAFFPKNAGNVVLLMYIIGVGLALFSSFIFRKTVLRGESTPFVMELPPYRMPTAKGVLWHVWTRTKQYFKKAGTILLPASIIIWAITSYPHMEHDENEMKKIHAAYLSQTIDKDSIKKDIEALLSGSVDLSAVEDEKERTELESQKNSLSSGAKTVNEIIDLRADKEAEDYVGKIKKERELEHSIAGRIGHFLEIIMSPFGFDWKIGISAITGFAAKEVVVSTLGILYRVGDDANEESESLRKALQDDNTFSPLIAIVLMLFTLIVAPCFAALAVIRAEIGWKWLGFSIAYTFLLAWILCTIVYRMGIWII